MNNLSLRFKLISAFAGATFLTLSIGVFGVVNQHKLVRTSEVIVNEQFPKINHVSEMRRMVREALGLFLQVNMVGNDQKEIDRISAKVLKTFGDTETELKAIREAADDDKERDDVNKIEKAYDIVKKQVVDMIPTAGKADFASHEQMGVFYRGEFKKTRFALYDTYDALYNDYKAETDAMVVQAKKDSDRSSMITMIFVLIGSVTVMGFGIWFAIHLSRDLAEASLTLAKETENVDESSQQLLEISKTLAESMVTQAAAVQQTAASVEEINSMIQRSSENARASSDVSNETRDRANEGRRVAAEVVDSMQKIHESNEDITNYVNESNRELAKIITVISEIENKTKVINDIVFQTKLLSFNASVEAARAGENGKGFAVVAEEVGSLAQMSGSAAKEISDILKSSLETVSGIVSSTKTNVDRLVMAGKQKVENGLQSARRSDEVLTELAQKMEGMNQMVSEISLAAKEQSQGVQEISKAITQFERVTNENVQSSLGVSSASTRLRSNAEEMKELATKLTTTVEGNAA